MSQHSLIKEFGPSSGEQRCETKIQTHRPVGHVSRKKRVESKQLNTVTSVIVSMVPRGMANKNHNIQSVLRTGNPWDVGAHA